MIGSLLGSALGESRWSPELMDFTRPGARCHAAQFRFRGSLCFSPAESEEFHWNPGAATWLHVFWILVLIAFQRDHHCCRWRGFELNLRAMSHSSGQVAFVWAPVACLNRLFRFVGMAGAGRVTLKLTASEDHVQFPTSVHRGFSLGFRAGASLKVAR